MSTASVPRHRVLLVREWDQQMSGSGCCGRLNTASVEAVNQRAGTPYARTRVDMERVGEVYRALRDRFDPADVELTVVDPRNSMWLLPAVWRDARRRGLPVTAALRQLRRASAPCTVVCDGVVLGQDVAADEAVRLVESDLARRC